MNKNINNDIKIIDNNEIKKFDLRKEIKK